MASTPSLVQHVLAQMGPGATARPMFGEYGVYYRGQIIGLLCDDRLFLKPTRAGAALLDGPELGPAYPGAKPSIIVPEEVWDDPALMARLARETAGELARAPGKKPARGGAKRKAPARRPRRRG